MSERISNVVLLCAGNRAPSILTESIVCRDVRQNFGPMERFPVGKKAS
jgi:hypothetical protein